MAAPLGNQNGIKGKEWEQSLKRVMARRGEGDYRITLDKVADTVIEAALAGEREAWQEIGNRMDGKAAQALTLANAEGEDFRVAAVDRRVVDPKADRNPTGL